MASGRYVFWAEGIGKSYGENVALKSASFWAEAGQVTTLLGRNGSGKTTLIRIAAGELHGDHGVVSLFGEAVEQPALFQLARRGLMFIPQNGLGVPSLTVRDHLRALASVYRTARVDTAVEVTGLGGLLDQRAATLSHGEQLRLSLGLAYARNPRVLLADEPLVGLAPVDQEAFAGIMQAMAREGTAIVTSGHDVPVLLAMSDMIVWSVAGTTHFLGSPQQAIAHTQFRREYLGPRFASA